MKKTIKFLFMLFICVGMLIGGPSFAGVYVIENSKDNVPVIIDKGEAELPEIAELNNGACKGFRMNTVYNTVGTGLLAHRIELDAAGTISNHSGPNIFIAYIVKGNGLLVNTKDGKKVNEIQYKAGDIFVFRPDTMHYWEGGTEKTVMFGIQQIVPK
jgi:quercetin dioxygenase-like cupin family protein